MRIVIAGATGLVGSKILEVLEERNFPATEIIPAASERSAGRTVRFRGQDIKVVTMKDALESGADIALFSAGSEVSREWAPKFAEKGCRVVDNSACWRMDPGKKLVVPEINGNVLEKEDFIIANPNCSTIQMLIAVAPIHRKYGIRRIVVSTYQSVTGTGYKALDQMKAEREGRKPEKMAYNYPIDRNLIPQIDSFLDNGYTKEEMKMVNETHKILDEKIRVTATTVRVPVTGGHSESVNLELENAFELKDIYPILENTPGVIVQDKPSENIYPMPLYVFGKNEVYVGRIRRDDTVENGLNLWIVADNLRKGAATNAVQIAEKLLELGYIGK